MKKNAFLFEITAFVLLLIITVSQLYGILRYKNTGSGGGTDNFYSTDVPIDVVIFGSSHAACTVNNGILWSENGIASYTLSAGAQLGDGTEYFVKEVIANNKPKVALIETYLLLSEEFTLDSFYRSALTSKFSPRFIDYTLNVVRNNKLDRTTLEDMLLRLPIVHSRYKELTREDFISTEEYIRGYRGSIETVAYEPLQISEGTTELSESTLIHVDKIIEACQSNGVEPVFFAAPYCASEEQQNQQNALQAHVESKGCRFLNYIKDYQEYGIDFSKDLRDTDHLNDYGAEKITRAISDVLVTEYSLPDRRGESGYELWDDHVRYLSDRQFRYSIRECNEVSEYLNLLKDRYSDFAVLISLSGNYRAAGDDAFWPVLADFGISQEDYEKGGTFILRSGNVSWYSDGSAEFKHYEELGTTDLNIYKAENDEFANIILGEEIFSPAYNGISVLVFDEKLDYIVDTMQVNVYNGTEVIYAEIDD